KNNASPSSRIKGPDRFAGTSASQRYAAPGLGSGAGVCPHSVSFPSPRNEGDGAPQGACPGLLAGPPDSSSGESGTPDPGASCARSARALRRATAAVSAFAFYGGRTRTEP